MKWLENCRLKCSFWWWWKDLIKINSGEPLCCAYGEDEGSLILLPLCCASGGGLPRCRALHLDEAKRVRDVSLMTQTHTSWRMHYRQHAAGSDACNTGRHHSLIFLAQDTDMKILAHTKAGEILLQTLNGKIKKITTLKYPFAIFWARCKALSRGMNGVA